MFTSPVMARALLLSMILIAWWNPRLPWQASPVDLMILIDGSRSIAPSAREAAWREVAAGVWRLAPGSRMAIVRFGAHPVEEMTWTDIGSKTAHDVLGAAAPPHHRYVDNTRTDIAGAMEQALRLVEPGRTTRIVLISDGRATAGRTAQALQLARKAAIPVYLATPPQSRGRDSWIEDLQVPTRIHAGQLLPVTITLASREDTRGTVIISLDGTQYTRREVTLSSTRTASVHLDLPLPSSRTTMLSAKLQVEGDVEPRNNRVTRIINIEDVSPVLYLARGTGRPALARSLRAGGWDVRLAAPAAATRYLDDVQPGSIVLDDVDIADMPGGAWDKLITAVTRQGTGLLVLGGPHAFGAGGYRRSQLEDILPVTAQARRPAPPAAVLFMLDTSGSMARRDNGPSRLALAREAMLESARRLQPDDAVGLIEFAAEPRLSLPLGRQRDAVAALRTASRAAPAGGTRLGPALHKAVTTLAGSKFKQKLLVVVTDGYVDESGFEDIVPQIRQAGIDVIALAIGRDADGAALLPLTRLNRGRLLQVDQVAQLPKLMRRELDKRRDLTASGHFVPATDNPVPFMPHAIGDWPSLTGYAVTKARATASVYLRVGGDPLFAAQYAGAGRVAVITAGLNAWGILSSRRPDGGTFAGGLLNWIDARHGADALQLRAHRDGDGMRLILETPWSTQEGNPDAAVFVTDPSGRIRRRELSARAPGRYEVRLDTTVPGRYHAVVRVGDHQLEHDWLYGDNEEFMPMPGNAERLSAWMKRGLLRPWSGSVPVGAASGGTAAVLRTPLLTATLLLYLSLLIWERRADLVRTVAHRILRGGRAVFDRLRAAGSTT